MTKDIYDIGTVPPLGEVPAQMWAQTIRPDRFGEPRDAFKAERVDVPDVAPDEALVWVAAAGINFNNVWAARGFPVDVCRQHERYGEPSDFHIGGSDASGIVWKVGSDVTNVKIGDRVVIHCGQWDAAKVPAGTDPMFHSSFRIWGYESNWGSFAQFAKVQAHQCMPKPGHLSWEAASAYSLCAATAYRMLMGWPPHTVQQGDVVLVWGGSGGLGVFAIQITREMGGVPVAVVSTDERGKYCMDQGAKGYINRRDFSHWGRLPNTPPTDWPPSPWPDEEKFTAFTKGAQAFGKAIWEIVGERKSPAIVYEHPGAETMPTSMYVCDAGGMVVICAGTSGYNADLDLRHVWMRQKRIQGSHFANDDNAYAMNELFLQARLDPCLTRTFGFDHIWEPHQIMHESGDNMGKMAATVGVTELGLTDLNI
jgi:crotonyl-CoA carboxylase/reductase